MSILLHSFKLKVHTHFSSDCGPGYMFRSGLILEYAQPKTEQQSHPRQQLVYSQFGPSLLVVIYN